MPIREILSKKQVRATQDEFLRLDQDGDGNISIEELQCVLRSMRGILQASEGDIRKALKDMDQDGNGIIDLKEYFRNMRNKTNQDLVHRALVHRTKIRKEFQKFDKDESGYITKDELLQVVQSRGALEITSGQLNALLSESDRDNDGRINYEEFVMFMTK